MFKKITKVSVALVKKYLPSAFVFAIALTVIAYITSMLVTGQSFMEMTVHWGDGFWSLLAFTMQMALVLILGNALASAEIITNFLKRIARIAKTPRQAIMLISVVGAVACWINWGFGLIVGALLAREIAKVVKGVDYRLLIASAYSGFVIWHAGFSGSVPLTVATNAVANEAQTLGALTGVIPVAETIFALPNLIMVAIVIIALPFINRAMHPAPEDTVTIDPAILEAHYADTDTTDTQVVHKADMTPAEKLDNSRWLSLFVVLIASLYLIYHFWNNGLDLNLNIVNLIFLTLGILLHQTPIKYVDAINEAVKGAGGIILQFPFYAGIMGLLIGANADGVSLAGSITTWFLSISNAYTFPMFTFWSSGLVNIFVPSGGGQWAVQAPIAMPAGLELGVDPAITTMAIAWGDGWTNMIQPFWALPALAIAKLDAKDIMGFCVMVLLVVGFIISLGFLVWAYIG
ncbi:MAG: short-chain fatty acid transporter [Alkalibacterium sp.]|uniref:short-chain fatty acid transporter n=1 Tax=Alkalibacterium sp. TaxID=1872447 RepID=UPI00397060CC